MANDWYVAIIDFGGGHYSPLSAAGSDYFTDFKDIVARNSTKIAAEVFNVSPEVLNRISNEGLLVEIADKLKRGEKINAQEELERLCEKD